jgi:hypothetical protein
MIQLEELGQRLALLEGDNCQQGVAREREIQSGVGSSMPVTILLPGGGVAFVMIAVFYRPVLARGGGGARFFFGSKTGEEDAGVALKGLAGIALLGPLALHEHCGAGAGQARRHWGDGFDGGFAGVDASVLGFCAQVKRGVFSKAWVAASSRTEVFSLVPRR